MKEELSLSHVAWKKSSFSNGQGGACTLYAKLPNGDVALKDSKLGESSPVLVFNPREWDAFIKGAKAGEFD